MKNLKINGNLGRFNVNLPERLEEISVDYLKECTDFVQCAPNYALVGIIYKDSLALVLSSAKKNKPAQIAIVPVFIKCGETDSDFINSLNTGDRCVIAASDLSIGHHIKSPYNKITPDNIVSICEGDKLIYSEALLMQTPVCFLEFKLVPINAIHAKLDNTRNSFVNPFVAKEAIITGEA